MRFKKIIYQLYIILLSAVCVSFLFQIQPAAARVTYVKGSTGLDHFKASNAFSHYVKVKKFDGGKILKMIPRAIEYTKETELTLFNDRLQALRFNIGIRHDLITYDYGLTFELYEFDEDGYLLNLYYYDRNGNPFGESSVDDIARREFIIHDYKSIERKFKIIDGGRNFIEFPEKSAHVTMVLYNSDGDIIDELYISSVDYRLWCRMDFKSLKKPSF